MSLNGINISMPLPIIGMKSKDQLTKMTKAVILARVSTLKQEKEGLSLKDIQLPELRDYAVKRDYEVVKEFVFSESADYKIRKRFNEMIGRVPGKLDSKSL